MSKARAPLEVVLRSVLATLAMTCALVFDAACGPEGTSSAELVPRDAELPPAVAPDDSYSPPAFCSRQRSDAVRDVFCGGQPPPIQGVADLERSLGLRIQEEVAANGLVGAPGFGSDTNAAVVLVTHSTALASEIVSPINPRAIVFTHTTFLAFARGVQRVELASIDRVDSRVNLYLVDFSQACNASPAGCAAGDLYTPRIESGWMGLTVRDDEDLKNTPDDCLQCHQRGVDAPLLLMRELDGPWTHFFAPDQDRESVFKEPSGSDLLHDYLGAKGDEAYAGIPTAVLRLTSGAALENVVGTPQPLVFHGSAVLTERWPYDPMTGYAMEPARSATWDAAFAAFQRGEQLALPYYAPRATDPVKQEALSSAYQQYASGQSSAEPLPDLADIFPDDPRLRSEIGLQTVPGATPAEALVQAYAPCHNDVLDQTISRARFSVSLSRLPRSELDLAIARLRAPRDVPDAMPPRGRRQLDSEALSGLIAYLERDQRPADDDAFLERAAQVGMAMQSP
jgi:hypothetical protein